MAAEAYLQLPLAYLRNVLRGKTAFSVQQAERGGEDVKCDRLRMGAEPRVSENRLQYCIPELGVDLPSSAVRSGGGGGLFVEYH